MGDDCHIQRYAMQGAVGGGMQTSGRSRNFQWELQTLFKKINGSTWAPDCVVSLQNNKGTYPCFCKNKWIMPPGAPPLIRPCKLCIAYHFHPLVVIALAALHMAPTANVVMSPLHRLTFSFIPCEGWAESCFSVRNI